MNDGCKTIVINNVIIQENGIIRNADDHIIGRLADDVDFTSEHLVSATDPNCSQYNMLDYNLIPDYTLDTIKNYINDGIPTGGFLYAVLSNDLREAISRADNNNIVALPAIVSWLYNYAPINCWGSAQCVADWLTQKTREKLKDKL